MLLTSGQGPQRSHSALSNTALAQPDPLSARSAQASVNHAPAQRAHVDLITPRDQATADSSVALPPPLSAHSAAPVPAPAAVVAAAAAAPLAATTAGPEAAPQLLAGSQPRVPPLPLASILSGGSSASASRSAAPPAAPPAQAEPAAGAADEPAACSPAAIPAQQAQSIQAELDFLLLAEEFAAATQSQQQQEEEVQQQDEAQGGALAAASEQAAAGAAAESPRASRAAAMMLLPVQRCSAVAGTLSKLPLSQEQVRCIVSCSPERCRLRCTSCVSSVRDRTAPMKPVPACRRSELCCSCWISAVQQQTSMQMTCWRACPGQLGCNAPSRFVRHGCSCLCASTSPASSQLAHRTSPSLLQCGGAGGTGRLRWPAPCSERR